VSRSRRTSRLALWSAAICLAAAGGCASTQPSGIDPSGQRVFTPKPAQQARDFPADERYFDDPMNKVVWDDAAIQLEPSKPVMAPVGTEIVLVAGVVGQDGYLRTNRRLEWTIAPGGVGYFVAVQPGDFSDFLVGDFNRPRKLTATSAIGSTSRDNVRINRGSCLPEDVVMVHRGEAWISLTSPVEGTSHVTVVAPEVYGWRERLKSATVHWVDVAVQYPPPAINPAGTKHVFTTTVMRPSTQTPCERWIVRYEITGGPAAGFAPDGGMSVDVPTNAAGQASVEISQKAQLPGENAINIEVIRPADAHGADGQRFTVSRGRTSATWSAASLAVHASGPSTVGLGAVAAYKLDLVNGGDVPARGLTASVVVPIGLTYLNSTPAATVVGPQLQWNVKEIGPRSQSTIEVQFRAEKLGNATVCCEASTPNGLQGKNCATTTVVTSAAAAASPAQASPSPSPGPPLASSSPTTLGMQVRLSPDTPQPVHVGDQVKFLVSLGNYGRAPAKNAVFEAVLDPGMSHPKANSHNTVRQEFDSIVPQQPGARPTQFSITVQVTKPGQLCLTTILTAANAVARSQERSCVNVVDRGGTGLNHAAGGAAGAASATLPISLNVIAGQTNAKSGGTATVTVHLQNRSNSAVQNIVATSHCSAGLQPLQSTDGLWGWSGHASTELTWNVGNLAAGASASTMILYSCRTAGPATAVFTVKLPDGRSVEKQATIDVESSSGSSATPSPPENKPDDHASTSEKTLEKSTSEKTRTVARPALPNASADASAGASTARSPGDGLSLSVVGLANAVKVGKDLTYEIRVTNAGSAACNGVRVAATLPEGLKAIPLGSDAAGIDGQKVEFHSADLQQGDLKAFRLRVHAAQAGRYRLHVAVTASGMLQPLTQDASEIEAN
jgi:uncharacterized repeat protein (TIGR01451 family)